MESLPSNKISGQGRNINLGGFEAERFFCYDRLRGNHFFSVQRDRPGSNRPQHFASRRSFSPGASKSLTAAGPNGKIRNCQSGGLLPSSLAQWVDLARGGDHHKPTWLARSVYWNLETSPRSGAAITRAPHRKPLKHLAEKHAPLP